MTKTTREPNLICYDGVDVWVTDLTSLPSLYHYYNREGWPTSILEKIQTKLTKVANFQMDPDNNDIWLVPDNAIVHNNADVWVFYPIPERFGVRIEDRFDSEPLAFLFIR